MSFATTAIITKGLTCGLDNKSACQSGIITTAFSLYCTGIIPPIAQGAGGGPYPKDAWNKYNPGDIQNFYQPVPEEMQYYVVPGEQEAKYFRRHKAIRIVMKMGNASIEKEYSVPEQKAKMVVRAFNMMEVTKNKIDITITDVKNIISDIIIKAKNLRLKK